MKYEINVPAAQTMIAAERAERVPPAGAVAASVAASINRQFWLDECGGEHAVSAVVAMLAATSNVAAYQEAVLREALRRLDEADGSALRGSMDLCGLKRARHWSAPAPRVVELTLVRRDGQPVEGC
jgi:hypothetical protein